MYDSGPSGIIGSVMVLSLTLLFPLILLALPLLMERVERPLRSESIANTAAPARPQAQPESKSRPAAGYAPAVGRYSRRRRIGSLRPERSAIRG